MIQLDLSGLEQLISIDSVAKNSLEKNQLLHNGQGAGNNFLGWVNLPAGVNPELSGIIELTTPLREKLDCIVVIGIGGSYLGTKAVLTALRPTLALDQSAPQILFAGHQLDQAYHTQLLKHLEQKNWGIVAISKSGTTTEPALAFRLLRNALISQFGSDESRHRIIAVTDKNKGALRSLADKEQYQTYVIPDDVGGRFSVLTPVGLIPLALAGIDIRGLVNGALSQMEKCGHDRTFNNNMAAQYAAARFLLNQKGKNIEILSNFNPALHDVAEWWKQLYGESEGKDGKGIFPSSVDLTTDLHSMGQFIQEGTRNLFETTILIQKAAGDIIIPEQDDDSDQLNYLAGKSMDYVNKQAAEGTLLAHADGEVPVIRIEMDELSAYSLGELFYFFEKACGISGYMLGVNPFDQPGVEAYKKNMFALLGKPGFEEATLEIMKRLKQ
ncbi:MAG: glucose-6-phosphate isomerase [Bacteroidetes bacterium]|jgi:glucose-6-phosphate isomerase|nr:glucose-6-phosphate isomerase [Bacteroidota bacterium]MBT3751397.1 glucose-6-phosphate isomerase [Bacteroidota bacterium]MBT4397902.1 glucose-6-phosphate isomerase [Bacteroidota bacterium]MBT5425906.1 glucose-6-phosphate isomerase [Bacteroidota bacterium]MBT7465366.1 glucose-6-phosphate isomerase [Bacteroidota bacterium]